MNMIKISRIIVTILIAGITACGGSSNNNSTNNYTPSQRAFYMGFTPWPYDTTETAVSDTYQLIQDNGDIVAHHLADGIPWEESLTGSALPQSVESDILLRLNQTRSNKVVYLAIDSLNGSRDDLALNWGDNGGEPLSPPWNNRSFDDAEVIEAYSNFALKMIDRFNPLYFNYASEVSELILNDPVKFEQFMIFSKSVYTNIKTIYPDLPLMVSIALKSPSSVDAVNIGSNFSKIIDFVDIVGVSVYPYAFFDHLDKGEPGNMPVNWLSQIISLAGTKPIAVTETGWPAEDLVITNLGISEQSNPEKQNRFVSQLLNEADKLSMEFVIWFAIVDYDALWNGVLVQDDTSKIWKDTGLYDEMLLPRLGLETWNQCYLRAKK